MKIPLPKKKFGIHSIKCPQCASTQNIKLEKNTYQCSNCGTGYILENNEYVVNHYHHQVLQDLPSQKTKKRPFFAILTLILVLFFVFAVPNIWKNIRDNNTFSGTPASEYRFEARENSFFETPEKQAIIVSLGLLKNRSNRHQADNLGTLGFEFYDAVTNTKIKTATLPLPLKYINRLSFRNFPNGYLYFILDERYLGRINPQSFDAEMIALDQLSQHPELSSGVAQIRFEHEENSFGLNILTNEGKKLYYFPMIDQIFTSETLYKVPAAELSNFSNFTGFMFFRSKLSDLDSAHNLVRYSYQTQQGWPIDRPALRYNDRTQSIEIWGKEQSRMTSFEEFLPERIFFNPKILASNDNELLIGYKQTPAPDELYTVQAINAKTGAVIWTYHVTDDSKMYYPNRGQIVSKGYFVDFAREVVFFDQQGKVITEK